MGLLKGEDNVLYEGDIIMEYMILIEFLSHTDKYSKNNSYIINKESI